MEKTRLETRHKAHKYARILKSIFLIRLEMIFQQMSPPLCRDEIQLNSLIENTWEFEKDLSSHGDEMQ